MPSPSSSLATLRPDLANFEEFDLEMDRQGFIGYRVLPVLEVKHQSGHFGRIPIEQLLQNRETKRTSRAGYSRGDWKFEPDVFATDEYGAEEPVDERDANMYGEYFDAEQMAAGLARDVVLRDAEKRIAGKVYDPTVFTPTPVTNEWDDFENCTPFDDVEAQVQAMYNATGLWPNALLMHKLVFRNLRHSAQLIDRVKYQGFVDVRPGNISVQAMAQAFDLKHLIVAGGTKNTADSGQTAALSSIWSTEYAMVARIAETNNIKEPCLGRTFHWGGDGSTVGGAFETYRDETVRGDVARCRHEVQERILYPQLGRLLSNITTTP